MRVALHNDHDVEIFSNYLLQIGNGAIDCDANGNISFPEHFCTITDTLQFLIDNVFPQIEINYEDNDWLCNRAILAPTNEIVNKINEETLKRIPGNEITYKSFDTVLEDDDSVTFPTEFLNSLEISGVPSHIIKLKVGVPIILMRNIQTPKLCNGTRLRITELKENVIIANILTGCGKGESVIIPRIPIIPTDTIFQFKRTQFPIKLAFSFTISKAQGQTLTTAGVNLEVPCFDHGQLYVACSRVSSSKNLYILAHNNKTNNVVYKHILQ